MSSFQKTRRFAPKSMAPSKADSSTQGGSAWSQAAESTCSALRISKTVGFSDDQTKTVTARLGSSDSPSLLTRHRTFRGPFT